jgi:hypothetical protein
MVESDLGGGKDGLNGCENLASSNIFSLFCALRAAIATASLCSRLPTFAGLTLLDSLRTGGIASGTGAL